MANADSIAATEDTPASGNVAGQRHRRRRRRPHRHPGQRPRPRQPDAQRRRLASPTRRPPNYNGPDSFTYKANDGQADSNIATVSITVGAVNDAPVAQNDTAAATEDTPAVGNVLANDTDVDGDALSAVLVSGPAHGSLTLNADGSFTYTPAANYNGPDSFTYKANDGRPTATSPPSRSPSAPSTTRRSRNADSVAADGRHAGQRQRARPTTPTSTATR